MKLCNFPGDYGDSRIITVWLIFSNPQWILGTLTVTHSSIHVEGQDADEFVLCLTAVQDEQENPVGLGVINTEIRKNTTYKNHVFLVNLQTSRQNVSLVLSIDQ